MIDKYTPCLTERETGKIFETELNAVTLKELAKNKKQGWKFNWTKAGRDYDVYRLSLKDDNQTQGLIALMLDDGAKGVYVNLVETAPHNFGSKGKYEGVGPHLFAFACRVAQKKGWDYVYFDSKTSLIEYYSKKLGAVRIGNTQRMLIEEKAFEVLIKQNFKE